MGGSYMDIDEKRWRNYQKKSARMIELGLLTGFVHFYDKNLIAKLRHIYYGGLPASLIILSLRLCNHYCYDRALLLSLAFEDANYKIVRADIDGIRLNPRFLDEKDINPHYANHCFLEETLSNGKELVYDTSTGLVYDKRLYYRMENPVITKISSKEETMDYVEYQEIKTTNLESDKYLLTVIIPQLESIILKEDGPYREFLKEELQRFKKEINYEALCEEVKEDMKIKRK